MPERENEVELYGFSRMKRVVQAVAPERLGRDFRWLLSSSWFTNLGDGIALAAGALLVASQTRDPFLVSMATVLQRLPWLLFGLYAGAVADRFDRRRIIVLANLMRTLVLLTLVGFIATDQIGLPVVFVALFALGLAEMFADITGETLLPMVVSSTDIGMGNARLMFGQITLNQLVGPPIGAALFAVGMAVPFAAEAALTALGAVLVARMTLPEIVSSDESHPSVRSEIVHGLKWLWRHRAMRTLALTILSFNFAFGAAWSVLVLLAFERLGMDEIGFGLLTSASAAGGVVGTLLYGSLERRFGPASLMRAGLIIETLTYLGLAVITVAWMAMVVFFVFGIHLSVWGTTSRSVKQRAVPLDLQGRIGSVYVLGLQAGLVIGALMGGVMGSIWGVTAPFWFAFGLSVIILALIWRSLESITHTP